MLSQDCCLILPPYPFSLEDPSDMSLEDVLHARPQLFFKCILLSQNGRPPKNPSCTRGPDDLEATLVFFSTFEELKLPATGPMDRATTKLYEQSPTPILYVAPCELMLGRVPLFPCFLQGNTTPAIPGIPHKLRHLKASAFQYVIADATAVDGRRGSNVYEVNPWLWQFGPGRPRLGGLSVSETKDKREAVVRAGAKRSQEPLGRSEAARRGDE